MKTGTYNYFLNGELTGITETFNIELLPDGTKLTASIRDAKPFKTTITVKTTEKIGKFEKIEITFKNDFEVHATYEFTDETFTFKRTINDEPVDDETITLPKDCVIFPLMRCFQGQTIKQIALKPEYTMVLVPDIRTVNNAETLLKPTFDERTAKLIEQKNNRFIYNYLSKHYDENSEFHLDKNGLQVYYKFVQSETQTWEVCLQSRVRAA